MENTVSRLTMEACIPYLAMVVTQLFVAIFIFLLHFVLTTPDSINATTLVVYEHFISTALLTLLAILFDRGKREILSLNILAWAFFLGILQVPVGQLLLTASLRYVTASFQSVGANLIPVMVFVLAVMIQREKFNCHDLREQVKLFGVLISAAGATVMVLTFTSSAERQSISREGWLIGSSMLGVAILAAAVSNIMAELIAMKFSAILTLSAIVSAFGTLQTVIIAVLTEPNALNWRIKGSLQLVVILYGGIIITGLVSFAQIWCIKKKGPVFVTSFSPLVIVFSFLLEMFFDGKKACLQSIIGALLVAVGLYLLLWGKAKEHKIQTTEDITCNHLNGVLCPEPLLVKDLA